MHIRGVVDFLALKKQLMYCMPRITFKRGKKKSIFCCQVDMPMKVQAKNSALIEVKETYINGLEMFSVCTHVLCSLTSVMGK